MMPTLPFLVCLIAPRGELAVANERLRRDLVLDPQRGIVSTRLVAADGAVALTGEEFRIRLADGRELTPAALPHCTLHPLPADRGARGALARYRSADGPHVVEVAWIAPTDVPWLLKQVRLAASGESDRVEWLAIEQFTLTDGSFTGGGCGAPARADNGLLLLPDHPGLECAVDGGRLAIRDHVAAAVTPTAWSATVTLALDRHATVLPERIASYAAERAAEGAHAAIRRIDAAWSLTDADLAPAADGPRTLPAEALRGAAAAIAAALRTAADDPARIVLLTPSSWLAGDRWFTSTLAPGAFGRALQELRSAPTAVALTVPFADAAGAPFALDSDEQLRAARKALVALLSADGRVAAPRWFVDLLPSTAAIDPRRAAQRVDGWIALLATQRKLAPEARLALVGATPLAPSWRRFGDHLTTGADEQSLLAAWPTAADRSARATALVARDGGEQPLLAFPRAAAAGGGADGLADAAAALAFWRGAPSGADAPQWRRNDGWRAAPFTLPARAGGWLRLLPWREHVGGDADRPAAGELGAHEAALFVPLLAAGASGPLPVGGRFEFGGEGAPPSLLLAPGQTQAFSWRDGSDGRGLGAGQVGLAPAFQRRSHAQPLALTLTRLAREPDGLRLELTGSTPVFRAEEVRVHVECDGAAAGTLTLTATPPCTVDTAATADPTTGGTRFTVALPESRAAPKLALLLTGPLDDVTALRIVAQLHETLTAVPTRPPAASRSPRALPPAPLATRRTSTVVLHDGPPPAVTAATAAAPASVETQQQHQ